MLCWVRWGSRWRGGWVVGMLLVLSGRSKGGASLLGQTYCRVDSLQVHSGPMQLLVGLPKMRRVLINVFSSAIDWGNKHRPSRKSYLHRPNRVGLQRVPTLFDKAQEAGRASDTGLKSDKILPYSTSLRPPEIVCDVVPAVHDMYDQLRKCTEVCQCEFHPKKACYKPMFQ